LDEEYVSQRMCNERRGACKEGRLNRDEAIMLATTHRDEMIDKLERKIDAILWLIVVNVVGLFILILTGKLSI